jgi:hypothetical protein
MIKHAYGYIVEERELEFPRFTSMRRKLTELSLTGKEIYREMCREFNIYDLPPIEYQYFVNNDNVGKSVNGFCGRWTITKKSVVSVDHFQLGMSYAYCKNLFSKAIGATLPHEICHAVHMLIDYEGCDANPHGEDFESLLKICMKKFPELYPACPGTPFSAEERVLVETARLEERISWEKFIEPLEL